jgi:hypothetical protein
MPLKKIVSGGQTGVDRAALDAALVAKFPCAGWAADRMAEDGIIPDRYPLVPLPSGGYRQRTRLNVSDSDGKAAPPRPRDIPNIIVFDKLQNSLCSYDSTGRCN